MGIRSADEMNIGRKSEHLLQRAKFCREFVYIFLRLLPLFFRLSPDLEPVLVGARIEKDLVSLQSSKARVDISMHDLKRKADVRFGVYVRQSGRNILSTLHVVLSFGSGSRDAS